MQAYIWAISGAIILSALVTILLPEGKIGKFINGILKLFCLSVMLTPLLALVEQFSGGMPPGGEAETAAPLDEDFIDYMYGLKAEESEQELRELLEEEFEVGISTEILWKIDEYAYTVTFVNIKIKNFGMYGEGEHILVIDRIAERTKQLFPEAEVNVSE